MTRTEHCRAEYARLYPHAPALGKVRELGTLAEARASIPGPAEVYALADAALFRPAGAAPGAGAVIARDGG